MAAVHAPRYLAVLRHRDLRLLFGGLAISAAGSWAYNVGLIVYAYEETHSALWVSAATIGRFLPLLFFQAYAGVLAERFERVRVMVSADVACTVLMSVVALLAAIHAPVILVLIPAAINSMVGSMYPPAVAAMLPQTAGEDDLAAANALNAAIDNVAIVVGPAIGAALLLLGPPPVAFAVNAASFAVSALIVMRMRVRSQPSDVSAEGSPLRQVVNGFKAITSSTTAAVLVAFSVLASFIYGTDTVVLMYVSRDRLGTGSNGYGYLLAALGVGGVLGAGLVDRLAGSPRLGRIIVAGMAVYCMPTAVLAFTHSPVLAMVVEAVRGAGTLVVDTLAITALQRSLPRDMVARVFGAFFTLVLAAISLGSLLTSRLLTAFSLESSLYLLAFVVPGLCLLSWPWVRRIDQVALARLAELAPRITLLEGLQIFAAARRPVLERLAGAATPVEVTTGTAIVREGDAADALYVLERGSVEVVARGELEQEERIRVMEPGSYFGEIGLLERIPRTATVRALEPCRLYRIAGDDFFDALTAASASTGLMENTRARLARSHPSYQPTFIAIPDVAVPTDETQPI
jgi:MFS family permease